MRYFKFDGAWPDIQLLKDQSASLTTIQQKQRRREKRLGRIGCVVSSLISICTFIGFLRLIQLLAPSEASTLVIILYGLLGLLGIGASLFVAPLIGALAAIPFWKTNRKQETYQRQEFYNRACGMLREYYEFREPFLVTKCYASSDRKFDRHDVCLFIVDDELRITANLHYGFFDPKRDLGCYGLTWQEIRLQDTEHKDRPAVQLQVEDLTFTLGCRAKAFIENDFLGRTS